MHTKPSLDAQAPPTPAAVDPTEIDRETPTPKVSGSYSAFRDVALDLVAELGARRGLLDVRRTAFTMKLIERLDAMTKEAETLALEFAGWPDHPPLDVTARSASIQKLMDLRDQVRSYLDGER